MELKNGIKMISFTEKMGLLLKKTNGTKNTKQNKTPQVKKIKQYLIEINGVKYKKKSKK